MFNPFSKSGVFTRFYTDLSPGVCALILKVLNPFKLVFSGCNIYLFLNINYLPDFYTSSSLFNWKLGYSWTFRSLSFLSVRTHVVFWTGQYNNFLLFWYFSIWSGNLSGRQPIKRINIMEPINAMHFNEAIGNNLKKGIVLTVSISSSTISAATCHLA